MSKFLFRRPLQTAIRFVLISVLTFSVIVGWSIIGCIPPAQSQLPSLPTTASNNPLEPPGGTAEIRAK